MVELEDTAASKTADVKVVEVQVLFWAPRSYGRVEMPQPAKLFVHRCKSYCDLKKICPCDEMADMPVLETGALTGVGVQVPPWVQDPSPCGETGKTRQT